MRRTALAALAGIAVLFAASLLLVARLTSDDATPRAPSRSAAVETGAREAPPPPAGPAALLPPPDATPATAPVPAPVALTPEVGARLAASASRVDLAGPLDGLVARVTSRCGTMVLRLAEDPADPARGLSGEAVLLLDLHVADGQARVTAGRILSQGSMRPALTACAQYALRNQLFPLRQGGGAGSSLTVPMVLSMAPGSPGGEGRDGR